MARGVRSSIASFRSDNYCAAGLRVGRLRGMLGDEVEARELRVIGDLGVRLLGGRGVDSILGGRIGFT